ncbi:SMP-30/gluconolactonase/LRE family protein [Paraburkholderia sp. Ac-20340]|uniref:SMP-30/gluconolactonase/LRE family protein n=1 Tax=Paraburkholderia sp. Ac-20340 TaxID=2703888 RepID=UPI00197E1843|nr:SMP-30/gluconolactonase/LRE family protein [Paraburkholderia sp. Ac-20340]MBN3856784.1 SMP-30/gluconolactonase/LRE family protein [Paraburkholderia sp. Ac-20340]
MTTPLVALDSVSTIGAGLTRPESVHWWNGALYSCDLEGVIAITDTNGRSRLLCPPGSLPAGVRPNGIARRANGTFIFANIGPGGGIWQVKGSSVSPLVQEIQGQPIPSTNFVYVDDLDRVWICVSSTDADCHAPDYRFKRSQPSGFVALMDEFGKCRIVADTISWTNECRIDRSGAHFYVNETIGRRLLRFSIGPDGSLADRETFAEFGSGTWPDGLEFDPRGNIWVTSPISNRVLQLTKDGRQRLVIEDAEQESLAESESAFHADEFRRSHFYNARSRHLRHITSITFSDDGDFAYLGSLRSESLYKLPIFGLLD